MNSVIGRFSSWISLRFCIDSEKSDPVPHAAWDAITDHTGDSVHMPHTHKHQSASRAGCPYAFAFTQVPAYTRLQHLISMGGCMQLLGRDIY